MARLKETVLRDFGGGWNVADSDKTLSSRFQPVSDNIVRKTDGSFSPRYGFELFGDFRDGEETTYSDDYTVTTVDTSGYVAITITGHGFSDGDHITITSFSAAINGLDPEDFEHAFGITVLDANNISIYIPKAANASSGATRTISFVHDTHTLTGRIISGRYFGTKLVVFDNIGEVGTVDLEGNHVRIWSHEVADGFSVEPWSFSERVSAEIVRGRLIACNGAGGDKPLAIDNNGANYLVDASTLSNGAVPRAEFVIATNGYCVFVNTEFGQTKVEFGARNTVFTGSRETNPSDAVEIDVGMMTQTTESNILGAGVLRDQIFLGFHDMSMLGESGQYDSNDNHLPDFSDNIPLFGTFAHHSIVSTGNDLFCVNMAGVNSLALSQLSGTIVPQTVSDLIHPALIPHLMRLNEDDRRYRVFSVYDTSANTYMLFAPKYSPKWVNIHPDSVTMTSQLAKNGLVIIRVPNHSMEAGDRVEISGLVSTDPIIDADIVNGTRRIRHVLDANTLVLEVDEYGDNINATWGGSNGQARIINEEAICYAYEFNQRLKLRRWTRFRHMNFDWGTRSQLGRVFLGKGGKVYRFGSDAEPIYADYVWDYDYRTWSNSTAYEEGDRVRRTNAMVYIANEAHTSPSTGSFADDIAANPDRWSVYLGEPIQWEMDTAWTEFGERGQDKQLELVSFDTYGTASFTVGAFINSLEHDWETYQRVPVRELEFVAQDAPGFGAGDQGFGGGRNTGPELLHSFPLTAKLVKLHFAGASRNPLRIAAVSLHYL